MKRQPDTTEQKELILGLFFLFAGNINCINNWGFYLFDHAFDRELELRNKIGSIWIISLLDSLEGESRSLAKYKAEVQSKGLSHLLPVCDQVVTFLTTVKEILSLYSKNEQLFLNDFRDQLVHSWLGKRHSDYLQIKYFNGHTIVRERISTKSYYELIDPLYNIGDMDKAINPLISRFVNPNLRYWQVLGDLQRGITSLREAMLSGRPFYFKTLSKINENER